MKKTSKATQRVRLNTYIEAEQKAALDRLSEQTRVPWAEYVREGINMVLAKYRKKARK